MKNKFLIICTTLIISFSYGIRAESDDNLNVWVNYFGDHQIKDSDWQLHLDTQIRRSDSGRSWQQFLVQPGIAYQLKDDLLLSAGYGYMETEPYGDHPVPFTLPEHRIYQQISVNSKILGIDLQHRFRMEQRFLATPSLNPVPRMAKEYDFRYENRFRYRLQTIIPITCLDQKDLYLRLYDEVFLNFSKDVAHNNFDQNRAYIGIGKRLLKQLKCEFGFMEQTLQHRDGKVWENNHTFMFSISSDQPVHHR